MTLITRLNTSFTDATLPRLRVDPVLTDTGSVLLFEPKNVLSHPSQETSISSSVAAQMKNMANLDNYPTFGHSGFTPNLQYVPETGAVQGASEYDGFYLGQNVSNIFSDSAHSYCVSIWLSFGTRANANNGMVVEFAEQRIVGANPPAESSNSAFFVSNGNANGQFQIYKYNGNNTITSRLLDRPVELDVPFLVGAAWSVQNGSWAFKTALNQQISGWLADNAGVSTNAAIKNSSLIKPEIKPGDGARLFRFYVEDLTVSGRTPEEVWAADWARGNGRFS